jgi:hypothetical protein
MNFKIVSQDTTLEAARIQFSIFRRIGIAGRAQMAIELSDNLRKLVEAGVRHRHPDYSDKMVQLAVHRLTIGEKLFHELYPGVEIKS